LTQLEAFKFLSYEDFLRRPEAVPWGLTTWGLMRWLGCPSINFPGE